MLVRDECCGSRSEQAMLIYKIPATDSRREPKSTSRTTISFTYQAALLDLRQEPPNSAAFLTLGTSPAGRGLQVTWDVGQGRAMGATSLPYP